MTTLYYLYENGRGATGCGTVTKHEPTEADEFMGELGFFRVSFWDYLIYKLFGVVRDRKS